MTMKLTIPAMTKPGVMTDVRPTLSEAEFLRQVIDLAHLYRWRVAHFRSGLTRKGHWATAVQGDGVGFPDLLLIRGRRVVAAELKVGKNKPTAEQLAWLEAFQDAGIQNYLWYPSDWAEIERVLGRD
jgi:hypothetical protein